MTYQNEFTLSEALLDQGFLEQLTTSGLDALPALFQVLLNSAMQIERQKHRGAAPHERTEERNGHANGFKDKTLATRLGQITVAVPQMRQVNGQGAVFYAQSSMRRLLCAGFGARHTLRAGLKAGTGRDVRAGRLHPQSSRDHRAAK